MFGVCDGHGQYGREASTFVKFALPIALEEGLNEEMPDDEKIKTILSESFESVHEAFKENVSNSEFSGSTCTLTLLNGHKIYTANCGDSRAILVNKHRKVIVLTNDHKANVETEKQRILKMGGRIHQMKDPKTNEPAGPLRIWMPKKDVPGLAMTRSIGDYSAHTIGVSSEPGKA